MAPSTSTATTALLRLLENERAVDTRAREAEEEAKRRLDRAHHDAETLVTDAEDAARAEAERMREEALAEGRRTVASEAAALERELAAADDAARVAHDEAVAQVTAWVILSDANDGR